jgi:single-strand DNA-binding protein
MNNVILIGRLTKDPDLRFMATTGQAVANFTLAVDKNYSKDKKQEMEKNNKPTADFIRIVVYGKSAENCSNYLSKGKQAAVQGRLANRMYVGNDGENKYYTEIIAQRVEFIGSSPKARDNDDDIFIPADDDDIPF